MQEPSVVHLGSVTSTQEVARALPIGSVVVAEHQSAGRGRLERRWDAPPGTALLASFVVEANALLSLATGVAAAEACGPAVRLKWPNDLMIGDLKLGGILVEVTEGKAMVGVGINLQWAPPGAVRLDVPRDELLEKLRGTMARWLSSPPAEILKRARELSATLGRRVKVEQTDRVLEGIAQDIDERGALVVDGIHVSVGDVIHVRT